MNTIINSFADLKSFRYIPEGTDFFDENGVEWKPVPEWTERADRYLISDDGDTYSIVRHKIMHNHSNDKGYFSANLCKDWVVKRVSISRIVAYTYIADIPEDWQKKQVNHKDENPANNAVENLEFLTAKENCNYGHHGEHISAASKGRKLTDEQRARLSAALKGKNGKPVIQYDAEGNVIAEYSSVIEAAEKTGLDAGNISHCARGERRTVGGFIFKYKVSHK